MLKKITLFAFFATISLGLFSQRSTLELTFTAENNGDYVQLDSIKVMNRTQGVETMIYWPDTMISLDINQLGLLLYIGYATFSTVGISEVNDDISTFSVYQNYPNPMADRSEISMYIPHAGKVHVVITDLQGKVILRTDRQLDGGYHSFRFHPGVGNFFFLTAYWNGISRSIQMISAGRQDGRSCRLDYLGSNTGEPVFKASLQVNDFIVRQSGILDSPQENQTYTFQFATNIPCPGTPTVEYEGQVYNTIQILSQCWLKENLNVGEMIPGTMEQSNNGIIEKYCYNNEPDSCTKYGGLYQWNEMMQYTIQQGARGICPLGWHLPTDEEWKVLEGAMDSHYGIGDPEWDILGDSRGYDAGTNLKTTSGWNYDGNGTDLFGFSGLPGGIRISYGFFYDVGHNGGWWASTEFDFSGAWLRRLYDGTPEVHRYYIVKEYGFSVRCLRGEFIIPTIELTFTAVDNASYVQLDSIKVMNRTQGGETMIYWPDTTLVVPVELAFTPGDELLYIGYANGLGSGMLESPQESQTYTFQFATNIPCPGTPTVEYEGQVYNTIQIFSQCWLKENLNVGEMIPGTIEQSNNGTIEKYCYNNEPDSCAKYGGLYQWNEMMQYTSQQGAQGICPPGWHLPTDEEWKVLEGAVDSQYGIGNNTWDDYGYRGYDAGTNLKTTSGWYGNGNGTDLFGFSGLPGGYRYGNGFTSHVGYYGGWWTSTEDNYGGAWDRFLGYDDPGVGRFSGYVELGFSVRCLRGEPFSAEVPTVITAEVTAVTQTSAVCGGNVVADGGAYVTARGVVWSTDEHPTIENNEGITYNGSGTGQYVSQLTGLNLDTEYFVRAYATNSQGTAYGEDQDFTTSPAGFVCGTSTITDIDGNVYNTVLIGSHCWMKENLKVGTMIAGSQNQTNNGIIEKYCYDNNVANCNIYGGLYQWDEAMQYSTQQGVQGICPTGWHIPTDAEWTAFTNYVSSVPDYWCNNNSSWIAKSLAATTHWNTSTNTCAIGNNLAANNATGFTALPGGGHLTDGSFYNLGTLGGWWSSTEYSSSHAWYRHLYYTDADVGRYHYYKPSGVSLRCLKD